MGSFKMKKISIISITFFLLFGASVPHAKTLNTEPDLEREKRMATEVEDAVLDGEVVYLKDASSNKKHEFMAIDQEAEGDAKGAVIIIHGRGFHPDWEDTIFPLRTQLPAKGWRTLSLQMPVLEKSAKYYDYVPLFSNARYRIEAGVDYLRDQGIENVILFAHSCGAHMAMDFIRQGGESEINAYIGAGMGATDYKQYMDKPLPLDNMKIPVLDIYGEKEFPAVIKLAPSRLAMMKNAGNKKSKQVIVSGADHYFKDKGDELVKSVIEWLESL